MKTTGLKTHNLLRSCLHCGSWINLRIFFCADCHQHLMRQFINKNSKWVQELKLKSLLTWNPGQSDVLSRLILQMKSEPLGSWALWAAEFYIHWHSEELSQQSVIVSSQSSSGKKHAQRWGEALAALTGYKHVCLLRPAGDIYLSTQKTKARQGRADRRFELTEDFSNKPGTRIIFVDDVVTTGHTALAAYVALKKPPQFEVWSLVYREYSANYCDE